MGIFCYLKSTIISKVVMAVTGILLLLFLFGHMVGNLQVFAGKDVFNTYAHFLQGLGELLWVIRISLFVFLVLHVITSIRLKMLNWSAKPESYKVKNYLRASINARTMFWTGLLIFCFLVFHLLHYTTGTLDSEIYGHTDYYEGNAMLAVPANPHHHNSIAKPTANISDNECPGHYKSKGDCCDRANDDCCNNVKVDGRRMYVSAVGKVIYERHDAYIMVIKGFQNPIATLLYIIGMIILAFHITHAIQSAFQTLGFNHPNYFPAIQRWSIILGIILALGYISIPVSILLGLVGGGI